ncbi:hypothetical protein HDU85_004420 [Gaertneriomyces sp. JEL0708]|nr:hypothetical protein HDU85_004420 [Gaertneriomyces sp. JEL0708]
MVYIQTLHLLAFRRFSDLHIELAGSLATFVGTNGSGKTSLLQAVAVFSYLVEYATAVDGTLQSSTLKIHDDARQVLDTLSMSGDRSLLCRNGEEPVHLGATLTNEVKIMFRLSDVHGTDLVVSVEPDVPASSIPRVRCTLFPRDLRFDSISRKSKRSALAVPDPPFDLLIPGSLVNAMRTGNGQSQYLLEVVQYLSRKHVGAYRQLQTIIKSLFPRIGVLEVAVDEDARALEFVQEFESGRKRKQIRRPWHEEGSGVCYAVTLFAAIIFDSVVRFQSRADGAENSTGMDAAPLQQALHILAVDEPSTPFHPHLIPVLVAEMQKLGVQQIIIATHSADLLSVQPIGASLTASGADVPYTLSDLDALVHTFPEASRMFRRRNELCLLSAKRHLLFMEDESDWNLLQMWMNRIDALRAAAFNNKVVADWLGGKKAAHVYADVAKSMGNWMRESTKTQKLKVAVVVDGDYKPIALQRKDRDSFLEEAREARCLEPKGLFWHSWSCVEIENYLLDEEAIFRVLFPEKKQMSEDFRQKFRTLLEYQLQAIINRFACEYVEAFRAGTRKLTPKDIAHMFPLGLLGEMNRILDAAKENPRILVDAKEVLKELNIARHDYSSIVRYMRTVPDEVVALALDLFDWAGV